MKTLLRLSLLACLWAGCEGAARAEHDGKVQVLLIGDSTTEGMIPKRWRPQGPHLEDVIRILLAGEKDLPPTNVINLGLSGEYVRRLLESGRYDRDVKGKPGADYIFVRYGLNDHNKLPDFATTFVPDYLQLIAKLKKDHPKAEVIVTTVIPYLDEAVSKKINDLNREVAKQAGVRLFDLYPRYAEELKAGPNMLNYRRYPLDRIPEAQRGLTKGFVAGDPPKVEVLDNQLDAHFGKLPKWFDDRHPNMAGYHVIGDETAKYLAKLMREKKAGAMKVEAVSKP
jgi:lysophospholipase L1-like esterase